MSRGKRTESINQSIMDSNPGGEIVHPIDADGYDLIFSHASGRMDSNDGSNDMMGHGSTTGGEDSDDGASYLREQDRFLPIANVSRIMKKSIPKSGKIAKDAKECVQECVSEFISFITSEASDRCHQEKRKTINGEDILHAMSNLGFDNYIEPLKIYLSKYREHVSNPEALMIFEKCIAKMEKN